MQTSEFLEGLYAESDVNKSLDYLFQHIDALYRIQDFQEVDRILYMIDLSKISITIMIGLLSITLLAHNKLALRQLVFEKVKDIISKTESPERVERLLSGLE